MLFLMLVLRDNDPGKVRHRRAPILHKVHKVRSSYGCLYYGINGLHMQQPVQFPVPELLSRCTPVTYARLSQGTSHTTSTTPVAVVPLPNLPIRSHTRAPEPCHLVRNLSSPLLSLLALLAFGGRVPSHNSSEQEKMKTLHHSSPDILMRASLSSPFLLIHSLFRVGSIRPI